MDEASGKQRKSKVLMVAMKVSRAGQPQPQWESHTGRLPFTMVQHRKVPSSSVEEDDCKTETTAQSGGLEGTQKRN